MVDIPQALSIAAMGIAAAVPSGKGPTQPVYLATTTADSGVELQVVGKSDAAIEARYMLEVSSGAHGNSNRTVQRGTARLKPNQQVTLMTLHLRDRGADRWSAKLHVEPSNRPAYDLEAHQQE